MAATEDRRHLLYSAALPLGLCLIGVICELFAPATTTALRYERSAIQGGEVWRLLTGNLVHLGWEHLLLNLTGLLLIWLLFGRLLSTGQWLIVTVISCLAVGLGLLVFDPELDWYVGLSGMLHGLFVTGLVINLRQGYRLEWLLLLALVTKLVWEQFHGAMPGSAEIAGGAVIVEAHLYGAVSGIATGLLFKPKAT
jgi:rhomboid family GlyGly-CTERM serine protease